jgi:hypothetical protein
VDSLKRRPAICPGSAWIAIKLGYTICISVYRPVKLDRDGRAV